LSVGVNRKEKGERGGVRTLGLKQGEKEKGKEPLLPWVKRGARRCHLHLTHFFCFSRGRKRGNKKKKGKKSTQEEKKKKRHHSLPKPERRRRALAIYVEKKRKKENQERISLGLVGQRQVVAKKRREGEVVGPAMVHKERGKREDRRDVFAALFGTS